MDKIKKLLKPLSIIFFIFVISFFATDNIYAYSKELKTTRGLSTSGLHKATDKNKGCKSLSDISSRIKMIGNNDKKIYYSGTSSSYKYKGRTYYTFGSNGKKGSQTFSGKYMEMENGITYDGTNYDLVVRLNGKYATAAGETIQSFKPTSYLQVGADVGPNNNHVEIHTTVEIHKHKKGKGFGNKVSIPDLVVGIYDIDALQSYKVPKSTSNNCWYSPKSKSNLNSAKAYVSNKGIYSLKDSDIKSSKDNPSTLYVKVATKGIKTSSFNLVYGFEHKPESASQFVLYVWKYKVTYKSDSNGKLYEDSAHKKTIGSKVRWKNYGSTVSTLVYNKADPGCKTTGWTADRNVVISGKTYKEGTLLTDDQAKKIKITDDVTLTLHHQKITYKVKYNGNGSTAGSMANSTHTYGTSKALTANSYKKNGYDFNGWNTNSSGTGINYKDKESVKNLTTTNNSTINLYAKWKIVNYKITYNNNSCGSATNPSSYTTETNSFQLNNPTKTGYTFTNWTWQENGTTKTNANVIISKGSTGTRKYTAHCTKNKYKVQFDANDSDIPGTATGSMDSQVFTYDTEQKLVSNNYALKNYRFIGWNTEEDGSGKSYTDANKVKNLTTGVNSSTPEENLPVVKLYAQWIEDFEVVIENPDGSEVTKDSAGNYKIGNSKSEYKVRYFSDSNGVITGIQKEVIKQGDHPSGTEVMSNNDDFYFIGWKCNLNSVSLGGVQTSTTGRLFTNDELKQIVVDSHISFIAVHQKKQPNIKYIVKYVSDSNGSLNEYEEVANGSSPTGRKSNPINNSYHFIGWQSDKDVKLNNGDVIKKNSLICDEAIKNIIITDNTYFKAVHTNTINKLPCSP